jgi:hypothetical protein
MVVRIQFDEERERLVRFIFRSRRSAWVIGISWPGLGSNRSRPQVLEIIAANDFNSV